MTLESIQQRETPDDKWAISVWDPIKCNLNELVHNIRLGTATTVSDILQE